MGIIYYLLVVLCPELLWNFVQHGFRMNGFFQGMMYNRRRQVTGRKLIVDQEPKTIYKVSWNQTHILKKRSIERKHLYLYFGVLTCRSITVFYIWNILYPLILQDYLMNYLHYWVKYCLNDTYFFGKAISF